MYPVAQMSKPAAQRLDGGIEANNCVTAQQPWPAQDDQQRLTKRTDIGVVSKDLHMRMRVSVHSWSSARPGAPANKLKSHHYSLLLLKRIFVRYVSRVNSFLEADTVERTKKIYFVFKTNRCHVQEPRNKHSVPLYTQYDHPVETKYQCRALLMKSWSKFAPGSTGGSAVCLNKVSRCRLLFVTFTGVNLYGLDRSWWPGVSQGLGDSFVEAAQSLFEWPVHLPDPCRLNIDPKSLYRLPDHLMQLSAVRL